MKKFQILAAIAAIVSMNAVATNHITLGDEVRIHPRYLDGYKTVTATMEVDGMLDDWSMQVTFPALVNPKLVNGITALDGMTVEYTDRYGKSQTYEAPLQVSASYGTISSHIAVSGYWDYNQDDEFECYGSAKWMPGVYNMFDLTLYVHPDFREGNLIFDGTLTSGSDQRGAVLQGVRFYRTTRLWVGYLKGDVNGDDKVNVSDVTILINHILTDSNDFDEFQSKAADFNNDGLVNITDATLIMNHIINNQ